MNFVIYNKLIRQNIFRRKVMKLIIIPLLFFPFFLISHSTEFTKMKSDAKKQTEPCKPSNDLTIMLQGVFNHNPITECKGNILSVSFYNLNNWEKRKTEARELFENASFSPNELTTKNGILNLKAGFNKIETPGCIDEYGSQVEYTGKMFSPKDSYTYSIIMKPTDKAGIVSAFFVHRIDGNTNNSSYCKNNNEIDIEVVKYGPNAEPSLRGKLFAYFTSWTRALSPWGYKGDPCASDPAAWDKRQRESHGIQLDERFVNEFHKYSFTWKPNEIDFYIDDVFMVKHTGVIPQKECPLKINTWAGYNWLGYAKEKSFSGITQVKQVSISSVRIK